MTLPEIPIHEKYNTGYVKPNNTYPPQPKKCAELNCVVSVLLNGERAYPLKTICAKFGYKVSQVGEKIRIETADITHVINISNNPKCKILDETIYATASLFNALFGMTFRYFDEMGILGIFM